MYENKENEQFEDLLKNKFQTYLRNTGIEPNRLGSNLLFHLLVDRC